MFSPSIPAVERGRWLLALLCGVLLTLGSAPFALPEAGWLALIPAWLILRASPSVAKRPWRFGYLVGFVAFGCTFWWLGNVTAVGALALILYLAVYPAWWFLMVRRVLLDREQNMAIRILGAACFWVTLEWVRSWMFTGFNWNELGHSQAESVAFRQLAAIGGVPFVSFFLVVMNLLWAEGLLQFFQGQKVSVREIEPMSPPGRIAFVPQLPGAIWVALGMTLAAYLWSLFYLQRHRGEPPVETLTFACIQPNIPQRAGASSDALTRTDEEVLAKQVSLSETATQDRPQLLLWPEVTVDMGVFMDAPFRDAMRKVLAQYKGNVLFGSLDEDITDKPPPHIFNTAFLVSNLTPEVSVQGYHKIYLVVVGEYLPFGDLIPGLRDLLGVGLDFTPGHKPTVFKLEGSSLTLAPLICFEDTVPEVVDGAAPLHPSALATISDDAWYTGWCARWGVYQHLENARFRCVENDLPMIRCGNSGITCQIDQNGSVVDELTDRGTAIDFSGTFHGRLQPFPSQRTFYQWGGRQMVLIFNLVTAMVLTRFIAREFPRSFLLTFPSSSRFITRPRTCRSSSGRSMPCLKR